MKKMTTCLLALMAMIAMTGCKPKASLHLTNSTEYEAAIRVYNSDAKQDYTLAPHGSQDIKTIPVDLMDSVAVQLFYDPKDIEKHSSIYRTKFPEATGLTRKYVVDVTGVFKSTNYPQVRVGLNSL